MATFITLNSFTDQGARDVKDTLERYKAFKILCKDLGVTVKSEYWTLGQFDFITTFEGSEDAVVAAQLKLSSLGNVRSQTLRAFAEAEVRAILGLMP